MRDGLQFTTGVPHVKTPGKCRPCLTHISPANRVSASPGVVDLDARGIR